MQNVATTPATETRPGEPDAVTLDAGVRHLILFFVSAYVLTWLPFGVAIPAASGAFGGGRASAGRLQRIVHFATRLFAGAAILCASFAATGVGYEAVAATQDAVRYPPPGRLVDVGGYDLHITCVGRGSPTVVLDAGAGEVGSLAWGKVPAELDTDTRVCSYDRAGLGWSGRGPFPRTAGRIVSELHTLLHNAGEPGPYVVVGHSLGGKHVRLYAGRYPTEVAGMVLVDARHEDVDRLVRPELLQQENAQTQQFRELEVTLRRLGVTRLFGPWLAASAGSELRGLPLVYFLQQGQPSAAEANISEIESYAESNAQLQVEAGTLGDTPIAVLMRGEPIADPDYWSVWQATQRAMARLSTRGRLIVAEQSGHAIQIEQPELVIGAVRETLAQSRKRDHSVPTASSASMSF